MELMVVGGIWVLDFVEWYRIVLEFVWFSEEKDCILFCVKLFGLCVRKLFGVINGCFVMYCILVSVFLVGVVVFFKRIVCCVYFKFVLVSLIFI